MKKPVLFQLLLLIPLLMMTLTGCELIGDIFQAGMAVGIILVVLVIGIIIWILRKIF